MIRYCRLGSPLGDRRLEHHQFMALAIAAARSNRDHPFGAVIVDAASGAVLAEGRNTAGINPVMHAEIDAICRLAENRPGGGWADVALYTTGEPCPMCQSAIAWAGIPTVYFGTTIQRLKDLGWDQIDIPAEEVARRTPFVCVTLHGGISADVCDALFAEAAQRRDETVSPMTFENAKGESDAVS